MAALLARGRGAGCGSPSSAAVPSRPAAAGVGKRARGENRLEILKLSSASETASLEIHSPGSALRLMEPHGHAPVLGSLALMGQAV